ncbi:MAG: alpha/beta hydrolase-fold protein [Acidobacteriota bacterium]
MSSQTRLKSFAIAAIILSVVPAFVWAGTSAVTPAAQPAQARAGRGAAQPPAVISPEILSDNRVVFRIRAPKATAVTLSASDVPRTALVLPGSTPTPETPGPPPGPVLARAEGDVWEFTTAAPVPPGAFRYVFHVDGVRTLDPANTKTSESNTAVWSLFFVPGIDVEELRDVPHGAIAEVFYFSTVLHQTRRMHVYTPPGYGAGTGTYPVFYLLHGAGDTDDAWTSVGRAGVILDNLIAAKQAVPMLVVMPAGHQPARPGSVPGTAGAGGPPTSVSPPSVSPFTREFVEDVMPYVERHYRTRTDRPGRAIAGLSMGGMQTLDIAFRHLERFAYLGVYSSGATLGGGRGAAAGATATPPPPDWEAGHLADLDNASLKKGTKLVWLATGVDDRLIANTRATVDILRKHGFHPEFKETAGAHTWLVWRQYLREFVPRLFK